jgi:hypothetical protein
MGFDSEPGVGDFSLHHRVLTSSGAHPASHLKGTGDSFPESKAAGAWSYTSIPLYVFMAWCLVKHRDNFTFKERGSNRRMEKIT